MLLHYFEERKRRRQEEAEKIRIDRDSVCMADDCNDNSQKHRFSDDATWKDLFDRLRESRFFAQVWGNDVVWVLENADKEEILSYYTKADTVIRRTEKETVAEICGGSKELNFRYYTSRESRGERVKTLMQSGVCPIGLTEEYELCR